MLIKSSTLQKNKLYKLVVKKQYLNYGGHIFLLKLHILHDNYNDENTSRIFRASFDDFKNNYLLVTNEYEIFLGNETDLAYQFLFKNKIVYDYKSLLGARFDFYEIVK